MADEVKAKRTFRKYAYRVSRADSQAGPPAAA
jgi:hypothetical protein